jgi:hypothetical protein
MEAASVDVDTGEYMDKEVQVGGNVHVDVNMDTGVGVGGDVDEGIDTNMALARMAHRTSLLLEIAVMEVDCSTFAYQCTRSDGHW